MSGTALIVGEWDSYLLSVRFTLQLFLQWCSDTNQRANYWSNRAVTFKPSSSSSRGAHALVSTSILIVTNMRDNMSFMSRLVILIRIEPIQEKQRGLGQKLNFDILTRPHFLLWLLLLALHYWPLPISWMCFQVYSNPGPRWVSAIKTTMADHNGQCALGLMQKQVAWVTGRS